MKSFTIAGIPYRILDLDAERGGHSTHSEPYKPFIERAQQAINHLSHSEKQHCFIIAYSVYGEIYLTSDPDIILRFSLAGEVYSHRRRMTLCDVLAVFYRKDNKFYPLQKWELRHFNSGEHLPFLNPKELEATLHDIFLEVKLTLGALTLTTRSVTCPAWRITTEKGTFFIPWHSGMIMEDNSKFAFEEKEFDEVKNAYYSLLSFTQSHLCGEFYKIRCC